MPSQKRAGSGRRVIHGVQNVFGYLWLQRLLLAPLLDDCLVVLAPHEDFAFNRDFGYSILVIGLVLVLNFECAALLRNVLDFNVHG